MRTINCMNKIMIKQLVACVFFVISLTGVIVLVYESVDDYALALLRGEDYIFYLPQLFPVIFVFPAILVFYIYCIVLLLLFPFRSKFKFIVEKAIIPLGVYCMVAILLGVVTAFVVAIYPLGTNYYKCDSTSMISSGSHYDLTQQ